MIKLGLPGRAKTQPRLLHRRGGAGIAAQDYPILREDSGIPQVSKSWKAPTSERAASRCAARTAACIPLSTRRPRPRARISSQRAQFAKHSRAHANWGREIRARLYRPARLRAGGRGLFPDRTAGAGPHVRRRNHARRLPARGRTSTAAPPPRCTACRSRR